MIESRNAAMDIRNERIEMLNQIRRNERSLYTFIERMAKNPRFAESRPNTHKFFVSLHQYRSVRGTLTDNQKLAINREIDKLADYFLTLRVAKPVIVEQAEESNEGDETLIERESIQNEV